MSPDSTIVVETRELTKVFGSVETVRALDGVNLTIYSGELQHIVEPSGSGKTTLASSLASFYLKQKKIIKKSYQKHNLEM